MSEIIRRKAALGVRAEPGVQSADQGWRLGFARAARDCTGLLVDFLSVQHSRVSLDELLELPPERSLLALLDGPEAGLGLMILSPDLLAALIERQTTGRVSAAPPLPRRPTRTDAAMVAATIDRALEELELLLQGLPDLAWAGGFRYASFLEDARPLGLLLEDQSYSLLRAELSLAEGARQGQLFLILPAEGRLALPEAAGAAAEGGAAAEPPFTEALAEVARAVPCQLQAVLTRLTLPLQEVMALQPGRVFPMPEAALSSIQLETLEGRLLARAKLGQNCGMRALRLTDEGGQLDGLSGVGAASNNPPLGIADVAIVPGLGATAAGALPSITEMMPEPLMPEPSLPEAAGMDQSGILREGGFPDFAPMEAGDGLMAAG